MKLKVIGIIGSGRKDGNTARIVQAALDGAARGGATETLAIHLADKKIIPCRGYTCDHCRLNGGVCLYSEKDDFEDTFAVMRSADGLILGTSVHLGTVSSSILRFLERMRSHNMRVTFQHEPQPLRNKVGGAVAVGIHHYGGQEFAIQTLLNICIIHGMVVVSRDPPYAYVGGCAESGVEQPDGRILCPPDGVVRDRFGLESARRVGKRVAEIAGLIKIGLAASDKARGKGGEGIA